MIWAAWLALCGALIGITGRKGIWFIFAALVLVQAGKIALHPDVQWAFSALCSVAAGACIAIYGDTNYRASALLMVVAGVMVATARFSGGGYEFGNIWLAFSDIAGVCAIIFAAFPDIHSRIWRMARHWRIGGYGRGFHLGEGAQKKVRARADGG